MQPLSVCLFSQCLSSNPHPTPQRTTRLERTRDGDHQRGIPQKDITGPGHGGQMFAVKVPSACSSSPFCGSDSCCGRASVHASAGPVKQRNSILPHLLSAVTERRKPPYHAVVRPGRRENHESDWRRKENCHSPNPPLSLVDSSHTYFKSKTCSLFSWNLCRGLVSFCRL